MSAAKCLACLMVTLVAAACVAHAQERIKICGRELIRLAVSSCGNARVRKSILDRELDQYEFTPQVHSKMQNILFCLLKFDLRFSTENEKCFFLACTGYRSTEMVNSTPESDGNKDVLSWTPHWYPLSSRIRRAAAQISDICCEKGCSMKELIQFC
uniref:Insulin-like 3 n=1 Tax=Mastacembelus armatus TaxID=205130 RepID=A0A3Q3LFH9_9TELE